jgi:hypothetical protein
MKGVAMADFTLDEIRKYVREDTERIVEAAISKVVEELTAVIRGCIREFSNQNEGVQGRLDNHARRIERLEQKSILRSM